MLINRVVPPPRLALIIRESQTLGYNPAINSWERLADVTAEVLRWLRAGRDRSELVEHLARRFSCSPRDAEGLCNKALVWCVFRQLLYIDHEPETPNITYPENPLEAVYWICTQECNLRCTYCYQDAMVRKPNELTTEEGINLVDQVVEAGASTLIFTGGEPFSRRDLLEIARYAKRQGLQVNVITNGLYVNAKNVHKLVGIFDRFTISLDHGVPEHHDRHRGRGSWKRAVRAIQLLRKFNAEVDVNSVLSRSGRDDLSSLMEISRRFSLSEHRIIPQFPMGRGATARNDEIEPTDIVSINDQMHLSDSATHCGVASDNVSLEGTYNSKRVLRNHCGAGLSEVSVDPEGWVYPCKLLQFDRFRTNNVRERSLREIFRDQPLLKKIRSTTTKDLAPCNTCIIRNHCGGGCRGIHFSFTQDYIKTHPLFCAYLRSGFELQMWKATGDVPPPRRTAFHQLDQKHAVTVYPPPPKRTTSTDSAS